MPERVDFSQLIVAPSRASTNFDVVSSILADQPAFVSVPVEVLDDALAEDGLEVIDMERDQLLPTDDDSCLFYLCAGQVAVGVFDQESVDERWRHQKELRNRDKDDVSLLPLPPLARTALKNLARFEAGDIFNAAALTSIDGENLAFFSLSPITVVRFRKETLAQLTGAYPELAKALGDSIQKTSALFRSITGVKQEIFDFYLRHGLSVSGPMVRVRQLDICIDCKQCEKACEERHAARRLTLGGFRLGMLDFVFSCRTCKDQRCLSPCEHDSISYDKDKGEVVIDHAKCIGCSLCAQSCPYGAIDMVNVSEPSEATFNLDLKARLDAKGFLEVGPGKRTAAPRRVANKCDHCNGFEEQACVSACPTGSLIEVDMRKLFADGQMTGGKKPRLLEPIPVAPFINSLGVRDAGLARIRDGRFSRWIWGLGIVAWLLALVEIGLRLYAPAYSLRYQTLLFEGLHPDLAKLEVWYLAGSDLALFCGYLGTALMVISMAYPMRRRMRLFMKTASNKYWLDLHLMTGTIGPLFIVLHSAMRLDNWVSVPFASMIMVVVSGVLGRYLYTLVPSMTYGHEIEELSLRARLKKLEGEHPGLAEKSASYLEHDLGRVLRTEQKIGLASLLLWLLGDEIRRTFSLRRRRRELRPLVGRKAATITVRTCDRIAMISRRAALAPRGRLLLKAWKLIHVPFSVLLLVTTIIHVIWAFRFSM